MNEPCTSKFTLYWTNVEPTGPVRMTPLIVKFVFEEIPPDCPGPTVTELELPRRPGPASTEYE